MMNDKLIELSSLSETMSRLIQSYLKISDGLVVDLHRMVIDQVEPALIETVMIYCRYNQSRGAKILGISRGTFRILLKKYFNERYCGKRG